MHVVMRRRERGKCGKCTVRRGAIEARTVDSRVLGGFEGNKLLHHERQRRRACGSLMAEFTAQSRRQLIETGTKVPVQPEVWWGGVGWGKVRVGG